MPIVLLSGYPQPGLTEVITDDAHVYFMQKPFDVDEFLDIANQAIRGAQEESYYLFPG